MGIQREGSSNWRVLAQQISSLQYRQFFVKLLQDGGRLEFYSGFNVHAGIIVEAVAGELVLHCRRIRDVTC